jgi:hypothetical protein
MKLYQRLGSQSFFEPGLEADHVVGQLAFIIHLILESQHIVLHVLARHAYVVVGDLA